MSDFLDLLFPFLGFEGFLALMPSNGIGLSLRWTGCFPNISFTIWKLSLVALEYT